MAVFFDYNQYWPHGFMGFMSRSSRPVSTINRATIGVSLLRRPDSGPRLDDGWAKAQPAVVLILKRPRKPGHGFKSHPTDWEKPRIKPRAPWYTRHMLPDTGPRSADPGVASSIPARSHTFVEIDHEIISTAILLPSTESFKKGCC